MDFMAYEDLQKVLQRLGISQGPAEYHGALCGMFCHGDLDTQSLIFDDLIEDKDAQSSLFRFSRASLEQLEKPEFMPILPDDDEGLDTRVEALACWCEGFLYGLGTSARVDIRKLSGEAQELVRDFIEISRADLERSGQDEGEEDERAYTELVEYVRVGAQLIFLEMHPVPDSVSAEQLQGNNTLH